MSQHTLIRFLIAVGGISLIIFVLTISITRQALYAPSSQELALRRTVTVEQRLQELSTWPPTPDNPIYLFRVIHDRIRIVTAIPDERALIQLELARNRLESARILLSHQRPTLALTTLTKSTKYIFNAAADTNTQSPNFSSKNRQKISQAISDQMSELSLLKPFFSDEQKSIIDRLLLELNSLQERFL